MGLTKKKTDASLASFRLDKNILDEFSTEDAKFLDKMPLLKM